MQKRRNILLHLLDWLAQSISARAQRQSLLADHTHLCKPRIRHVCIVHYAVSHIFKYLLMSVASRSTRPKDLDVCSLLTVVCPTVGMEGTPASCGDYLVVLERIRLP